MRIVLEIIGIVLLLNGVGGLVFDGFGIFTSIADGPALIALQVAASVLGAALIIGSLMNRKAEKSREKKKEKESDDSYLDDIADTALGDY